MVDSSRISANGRQAEKGKFMTIDDAYRYVGFPRKRRNCGEKARYANQKSAAEAAWEHNHRVFCEGMSEYPCRGHRGWHVGHSYRHSDAGREMRELVEFFEQWWIQSQSRNGGAPGRLL